MKSFTEMAQIYRDGLPTTLSQEAASVLTINFKRNLLEYAETVRMDFCKHHDICPDCMNGPFEHDECDGETK